MQFHSFSPSVVVAKVAVVVARAKVAAVAREVVGAKVVRLVQERAKEVAILQPGGHRPPEIRQAAADLTNRQRASEWWRDRFSLAL